MTSCYLVITFYLNNKRLVECVDLDIKRKERKVLNSSLYSLTHRNARTIKLVSLRVRHIGVSFSFFSWSYLSGFEPTSAKPNIIGVCVANERQSLSNPMLSAKMKILSTLSMGFLFCIIHFSLFIIHLTGFSMNNEYWNRLRWWIMNIETAYADE